GKVTSNSAIAGRSALAAARASASVALCARIWMPGTRARISARLSRRKRTSETIKVLRQSGGLDATLRCPDSIAPTPSKHNLKWIGLSRRLLDRGQRADGNQPAF